MNLLELQISNEYVYDKKHTIETIKKDFEERNLTRFVNNFIKEIVKYFAVSEFEYVLKDGTKKTYETKKQRYEDMRMLSDRELESLAWKTVIWSTIERTSFTAVVGKLSKLLPHEDRLALETASEILGVLSTTPFINIEYPMHTEEGVLMIVPQMSMTAEITEYLDNQRLSLPSLIKPQEIVNNTSSGYQTYSSSIFTKGKHHDSSVNLRHLNRQNSIPLCIDERVYLITEPVFKDKRDETEEERVKRLVAFRKLNYECIDIFKKYTGSTFYLTHKYDERLRTYARAHHINSQGADYQKCAIELAEPELIKE